MLGYKYYFKTNCEFKFNEMIIGKRKLSKIIIENKFYSKLTLKK